MKYYMFNGLSGEETNNTKKQLNKKKIWKVSIVLFCIALIVSFIVLYTVNERCREVFDKYIFRKQVYENNLPIIEINSSQKNGVCAYDKYIGVLEQNILNLYNKSGFKEHSLEVEISNPLFESNGGYLCIAEKGGQKVYLILGKNIVWQNEIEGNISSISLNKNGYVNIIISGTSYKTVIATYDEKGKELFKTYLSTTNVIDTDISPDNKYLAVAEANFSGIVIQSTIKIISIEDAQKQASQAVKYTHFAEANDLIINIKYQDKNQLVCMYDEYIDILKEGQNNKVINFKNEDVLFSDIKLESKIIKIEKKPTDLFNAEAEMKIINNDFEKEITYVIENIPKAICVKDNMIAINLGTNALFINENGWLVKDYKASQEIQKIVLCGNIAGIVSKNKIEVISL
ncbi:MAG: DUF5711 family protein [Clostridia bacterium]|nr:DUF5711 family protein [Clostridia bacterium]